MVETIIDPSTVDPEAMPVPGELAETLDQTAKVPTEANTDEKKAVSELMGHIKAIIGAAKDEAARIIADATRKAEEEASEILARARREAERIKTGAADNPQAEAQSTALESESVLYFGELDLLIGGAPDNSAVQELAERLQAVSHLGVGRPQPLSSGGVALPVNARVPTPLLRIVRSLPIVKDAVPAAKDIELALHSGPATEKPHDGGSAG